MADDWANENRTVEYQKNTTFKLNQKPGTVYPLAGSTGMYQGASSQIEDQFDDDFNLEDKQGINTDTNNRDASSDRRWVKKPKTANVAPLLDRDAMKATSVDIDSPLVEGTARGVRRYHDDTFIEGYFGTAWIGEHGDTPVPFKAGNRIVVDLGGAATGLTEEKIIRLAEAYQLADVDIEEEQPIVFVTPRQESELMMIDRYVKWNYDEKRPLARRELKPWQNLRFFRANFGSSKAFPRSSKLTLNGSTRLLPTFVPSGMHRAVWTEFFGRITERDDKNFSKQVYAEACSTATRLMEDKCFILECKEG